MNKIAWYSIVTTITVCLVACGSPPAAVEETATQDVTEQFIFRPETVMPPKPAPTSLFAVSPTPTFISTPSQTPAFTQRPPPTSTPDFIITPSPSISLSNQGPWLAYVAETGAGVELVATNPDSTWSTVFKTFQDVDASIWGSATSPWLAVELLDQNQGESTLTLYQMPGGEPKFSIFQSFGFGIQAAWSPDGRYLAFTAQIDGPSTDLYIYDTQDNALNRITSGSLHAINPRWSPSGTWIILAEVKMLPGGGASLVTAVYATALQDHSTQLLYEPNSFDEWMLGWVTTDTFAVYSLLEDGNVAGNSRLVNVNTRQVTPLYPGNFSPYAGALDPTSQVFVFSINPEMEGIASLPAGLYLQYPEGEAQRIEVWGSVLWDQGASQFVALTSRGETLGITPKGEISHFSNAPGKVAGAPNGQWLAFYGSGSEGNSPAGLNIYAPNGDLHQVVTTEGVHELLWRPDSAGLFYTTDNGLYYLVFPGGQPEQINERKAHGLCWVYSFP